MMEPAPGSSSLFAWFGPDAGEREFKAMSMRTVEKPGGSGQWHKEQAAELVNGTVGFAVCFALVCLFLIAMAR